MILFLSTLGLDSFVYLCVLACMSSCTPPMYMSLRRTEEATGFLELEFQGSEPLCGCLEPNKRSRINFGAISLPFRGYVFIISSKEVRERSRREMEARRQADHRRQKNGGRGEF